MYSKISVRSNEKVSADLVETFYSTNFGWCKCHECVTYMYTRIIVISIVEVTHAEVFVA